MNFACNVTRPFNRSYVLVTNSMVVHKFLVCDDVIVYDIVPPIFDMLPKRLFSLINENVLIKSSAFDNKNSQR